MKKLMMLTAAAMFMTAPAMAHDHDGKQMKSKEKMEKMFKDTDTNGDNMIAMDEYMNHVQEKAAKKFVEKDKNDDGMVSMEEAKTYYEMKKDKMKNKDENNNM